MSETAREQAERLGLKWPGEPAKPKPKPVPVKRAPVKREPRTLPPRVVRSVEGEHRTIDVCRATGLTYRQLDYYDRSGFISPSIKPASGSGGGKERLYSDEDVRLITVTKRLLDLGFTLQAIRKYGPDKLDALIDWSLHNVEVSA